MSTKLPRLSVEIRHVPDWPGYAIDRNGTVWQLIRGKWMQMQPRRTSAGLHAVWLYLPGGIGNATRRIADIYMEVFDDPLPETARRRSASQRRRPS